MTRKIIQHYKKLAARTRSTDHERQTCFEYIKATGFLRARGPVGRLWDTIYALRWTWPHYHVVRNHVGADYDLMYTPHAALLHWLREAQRYFLLRSVPDTRPSLQGLVAAEWLIDIPATTAMLRTKKTLPIQQSNPGAGAH